MNISVRLTFKGEQQDTRLQLYRNSAAELYLRPDNGYGDIRLMLNQDGGTLVSTDFSLFEESKSEVEDILAGMLEKLVEIDSSGLELTLEEADADDDPETATYPLRDIYVENKPFSISQLMSLITEVDLELKDVPSEKRDRAIKDFLEELQSRDGPRIQVGLSPQTQLTSRIPDGAAEP